MATLTPTPNSRKRHDYRTATLIDSPTPLALTFPQALLNIEHDLQTRYLGENHDGVFQSAALCGDAEIVKSAFLDQEARRRAVKVWRARRIKDVLRLKPRLNAWFESLDATNQKRVRCGKVPMRELDSAFFNYDQKRRVLRERVEHEESKALTRALNAVVQDADVESQNRLYPVCVIITADGKVELWHDSRVGLATAKATGRRFIVLPIDVMQIAIGGGASHLSDSPC